LLHTLTVETSYTFLSLVASPLFNTASFFRVGSWESRCLCTDLHGGCVHGHHYTVLKCQNIFIFL